MSEMVTMSPKRRAWLEHLRDHGPAHSGTRTGLACRVAGLTEWFVVTNDGEELPISALYARFPGEEYRAWQLIKRPSSDVECITDAGRSILRSIEGGDRG